MKERDSKRAKIAFFGHFDSTNFGNESTLQAILYHLRCFQPGADITCITNDHEAAIVAHHIAAIPVSERFMEVWCPRNPVIGLIRKIFVGIPSELYRWISGLMTLGRTDMLIIPGTGLLTDAYGLAVSWGPYHMFKWSLIAKLCRCKLLFVSVGAGPLYSTLGRWFVRSALALADFRSYRDNSSAQYLKGIGVPADVDRVYPDLAFSLPETVIPDQGKQKNIRPVVGIGVMDYAGKYSVSKPRHEIYLAYLDGLEKLVRWLLAHDYDVRLLIGDLEDVRATQDFRRLLRERLAACDEERIIEEPVVSVDGLLLQIAATDMVVATRFHNVLLSLLCNKPVVSIAFHRKCEALMSAIGLSAYCLDINTLNADRLIETFRALETNADKLRPQIDSKVKEFRSALEEQYRLIFHDLRRDR
jgi:polysaccharide pyruvyl transferase WcaK-like protein